MPTTVLRLQALSLWTFPCSGLGCWFSITQRLGFNRTPSICFFLLSPPSRLGLFHSCVVAQMALGLSSNSMGFFSNILLWTWTVSNSDFVCYQTFEPTMLSRSRSLSSMPQTNLVAHRMYFLIRLARRSRRRSDQLMLVWAGRTQRMSLSPQVRQARYPPYEFVLRWFEVRWMI